jgi:hypothetical protein
MLTFITKELVTMFYRGKAIMGQSVHTGTPTSLFAPEGPLALCCA